MLIRSPTSDDEALHRPTSHHPLFRRTDRQNSQFRSTCPRAGNAGSRRDRRFADRVQVVVAPENRSDRSRLFSATPGEDVRHNASGRISSARTRFGHCGERARSQEKLDIRAEWRGNRPGPLPTAEWRYFLADHPRRCTSDRSHSRARYSARRLHKCPAFLCHQLGRGRYPKAAAQRACPRFGLVGGGMAAVGGRDFVRQH